MFFPTILTLVCKPNSSANPADVDNQINTMHVPLDLHIIGTKTQQVQ